MSEAHGVTGSIPSWSWTSFIKDGILDGCGEARERERVERLRRQELGEEKMGGQLVTENSLDEWVRAHSGNAQRVIVELIYRLVLASCPNPTERRFPLGDSIGQHGPDGYLETPLGFLPFVPEGRSFWEIGTNVKAGKKATDDYRDLTKAVPPEVRASSSFVFVTPLSARRGWEYSWKPNAQARWLAARHKKGEWRSVAVIDGTRLIDWLQQFSAAEVWLAGEMGLPVHEMQTPEQRWAELRTIGEPPPLSPEVFLVNREDARVKLAEAFEGKTLQVKLDTHFPRQVVDFVCAYLASVPDEKRAEAAARCLIVSGASAWSAVCALRERHTLVADFEVDEEGLLLERARRAGHVVVFGGQPGGIPYPNRASLHSPKAYQIEEALKNAGYPPQRARTLAQKSGGNLTSLLRHLQSLLLMPEWTQGTDASELAIAQLLGAWQESSQADRSIVEKVSGKAYGEWIGMMREVALRPGTPLSNRDGLWRVGARYEAWYALGSRLFDEHLDRFQAAATLVLRERNPKFDFPSEEQYIAAVRGKVLAHSGALRKGLAESLALVGSHGRALTSCSLGKTEAVAALSLRAILADADWDIWASLDGLIPLLAEAAPREFLDNVERALNMSPSPLAGLFAHESSPLFGTNYMSGLLWALETLAWDAEHLTRVVLILGELAAIDPGGQWGNRPANSLTTILLPWLPQTCAPLEKRLAAVAALTNELPEVGWKLLLSLLPSSHQTSSGTSKPTWRETIPEDWSVDVTRGEYTAQVEAYTESALVAARANISRLAELINRLDDLALPAQEKMLAYLSSEVVISLSEADKYTLWTKLTATVANHRKYAQAEWALPSEHVDRVAEVAAHLEPTSLTLRHQRIFSGRYFELFDQEDDDYSRQEQLLDERRQEAIGEILASGGISAVLEFAKSVESPWQIGSALGMLANGDYDRALVPALLMTEERVFAQVAGSFIRSRHASKGWAWVDQLPLAEWTAEQVGQFLAYLPFVEGTWQRVAQFLSDDEAPYWTKTSANPYEARGQRLEFAADSLLAHGRPHSAISCLYVMLHETKRINGEQAISALLTAVRSEEKGIDTHQIVRIIKALQDDPCTDQNGLFRVEWAYLPLLERRRDGVTPALLERRLAEEPDIFCELIRLIFRSKKEDVPITEPSEEQKTIAENAYRLLRNWKTPPGTLRDGSYDGAALTEWLNAMKASCSESGHLDVAMLMTGHVLVSAPPDPGGLWIHRAAALALNAKDASKMRDGFKTELFNSRGIHGYSAGKDEDELAAKYRTKADEVEVYGYSRLATALRDLAASYEREAERERLRDPYSD